MTDPLLTIIDREQQATNVQAGFKRQFDLLTEMVNYGSCLVVRCWETSDKRIADAILSTVLGKQAVTMLDGVDILLRQAAATAAHTSLRSLYETHLSIKWMLEDETEIRAKRFYVQNLRRQLAWLRRTIPGTDENSGFQHVLERILSFDNGAPQTEKARKLVEDAEIEADRVEQFLNSPTYAAINDEFDQHWRNSYDPSWYALKGGPSSIRQVAIKLKELAEYDVYYSRLSAVCHGEVSKDHMTVTDGGIEFEPIRYPKQVKDVVQYASVLTGRIYAALLEHFRPGELDRFGQKWRDEWHPVVLSMPDIEMNVTYTKRP